MLVLEFIFRALPHIFRTKSIQPPSKNVPYTYASAALPRHVIEAECRCIAALITQRSSGRVVQSAVCVCVCVDRRAVETAVHQLTMAVVCVCVE